MKKYYRVNVPAHISFDVVAESEEQAKRIAAAAVHTPVTSLINDLPDFAEQTFAEANLAVWSHGDCLSGRLDGSHVEIVDHDKRSDEELKSIEEAVAALAYMMGNDTEFAAALKP
jgi:hypothetical protein